MRTETLTRLIVVLAIVAILAAISGIMLKCAQAGPAITRVTAGVEPGEQATPDPGAAPASGFIMISFPGDFVKVDGDPSAPHIYTKARGDEPQSKDMAYFLMCYDLAGRLLWKSEVQYLVDLMELPDGRVFVGGTMKTWLLDAEGNLLHEEYFSDECNIFAEFALAPDGTILGLLNRTWLYAFADDGTYRWDYGPGDHQAYRVPLVTGSGTIILYNQQSITALDMDGNELWQRKASRVGNVSLIDGAVIYEPADLTIASLDITTGEDRWQHKYNLSLGKYSHTGYACLPGDTIALWALQGGVQCLDRDGNVLWDFDESAMKHNLRHGVSECAAGPNGNLYVCLDNELLQFSPAGEELWRVETHAASAGFLRTVGDYIVLRASSGMFNSSSRIQCYDGSGELVWKVAEDKLGTGLGPAYPGSEMLVWRQYQDNRDNPTTELTVWRP